MQFSKNPFMDSCYQHDKGTMLSDTEQDDDGEPLIISRCI